MKRKQKIIISLLSVLVGIVINGQTIITNKSRLDIQPEPKQMIALDKSIVLCGQDVIHVCIDNTKEQQAANYFMHLLEDKFKDALNVAVNKTTGEDNSILITFEEISDNKNIVNDQYYEINVNAEKSEIVIGYTSQLGLIYGTVTLSEYFEKTDKEIVINLFDVKDYPDFSRRIISANPAPENVFQLLDFALKNKIETIAIASRRYPWYEVSEEYKNLFAKIKEWKDKYGAPCIMQMHNIYEEKEIEISNEEDIKGLLEVIKTGIENGADKLMILADDTPPFTYGEGYVLTSENDKQKFKHMAEANCYLIQNIKNWLNQKSLVSEIYYVPAFYTYEDMYYGDMELYKNTPWEDDAYKPLYRDLNYIGLNMPDDVFVIWTGPVVRSRTISEKNINDWTYNLKGITPFLWDNTIYSHNPFISIPLFSAWDNDFPADFNVRTAGNGMFINGDANSEDSKATVITTNDYMWNSRKYSPEKSLNKAMMRLYGEENSELILKLREVELSLRKTIGERELWFESDTLWTIIRKIRFIHTKNPFYYHYNYTRMKALRLQLKGSVPEPIDKKDFINKCITIDKDRKEILDKLQNNLPEVTFELKKLLLELPDFNEIQ